ncbi:thiamine-phosphate kinase [Paraglaciecola mesophila]|uniref:Thiamine-monophosphate kinase n=2 Tax=Paraglaciecola mesophila TaxID=197222 RepID=K6ZKZ1_9ALTE|nr:thiamine-phosphate kinase [Paraglaciecola mesophila]GAC24025.1 thiamine-monophosphate kinase [Paraglaciecola mesophila KMM 241]
MKEFSLIDTYFRDVSFQRKDVLLGIGDDCAITQIPAGQALATTTDTLVSGVHFLPDADPKAIAQKAIAVNLSDLAAMGAEPAWLSLSLSLPNVDEQWLKAFSEGFKELTEYYSVQLIGGDTVQGPLAITITAQGFVAADQALKRSGAKPGDFVYVTGSLGDAGLGLDILLNHAEVQSTEHSEFLLRRLHYPTPRVFAGTSLRRVASACIDISDGLLADIKHILNASQCGACLQLDKLPLSKAMLESVDRDAAFHYALSSGDDYELLFTVSEEQKNNVERVLACSNVPATCIGQINGAVGKIDLKHNDESYAYSQTGFEHFNSAELTKEQSNQAKRA